MTLAEFVSYLADKGLIDITHTRIENDDGTNNELGIHTFLTIQKFSFFIRYCGADLGYRFDTYIEGPFSFQIEDDYRKLDFKNLPLPKAPQGLDEERFLSMFGDKKYEWLEIAGIILLDRKFAPEIDSTMMTASMDGRPGELLKSVRKDLIDLQLY